MNAGAQVVEMGGLRVAMKGEPLVIQGLGSCIGIFLFEEERKIGAMAHAMLPGGEPGRMAARPGKYVQSAVAQMVAEIIKAGGHKDKIRARLAGGAHMFQFDAQQERSSIGDKNIAAAREALREHNIELAGEDTGGVHGRTLRADTAAGRLEVHTIRGETKVL